MAIRPPHTLACVAEFQKFRVDQGDTVLGTDDEDAIRRALEASTRTVLKFLGRSRRSGFGPRIGTNRYNHPGGLVLRLDDDLLAITSVTMADAVGGSTTTLTDETHFLKRTDCDDYDSVPYRELEIHPESSASWGVGRRGNSVAGTWGYSDDTVSLGTMGTATAGATTVTLSAGTASAGMTLLVDSEQMYVTAGGTAPTVVRGVNGTTAAQHASSSAVSRYVYDSSGVEASLMIAHRRWKAKQAGLTGDFGSPVIATTSNRDSEWSILRNVVGHLRIYGAG